MAAFGTGGSRAQVRGPSLGFRFTLYAVLSTVVMFLDQRHGWLEQARFALQAAAYPIQLAVNSPSAAWNWLSESFETRDAIGIDVYTHKKTFQLHSAGYTPAVSDGRHLYLVGYFSVIGLEPAPR